MTTVKGLGVPRPLWRTVGGRSATERVRAQEISARRRAGEVGVTQVGPVAVVAATVSV